MKSLTILVTIVTAASAASLQRKTAHVACSTCNLNGTGRLCNLSAPCTFAAGVGAPNLAYCTCSIGFKADPREVGADPAAQWRLPWAVHESQVFVRWEVACNTKCVTEGCAEIPANRNPQCFA